MPKQIKVKEAMIEKVVNIEKGKTAREAGELMKQEDVGSLIVTENGNVVGIITATDLVRKIVARNLKPEELKVEEVMSKDLYTINPDDNLVDASMKILKKDVKRLPVVEDENLVGVLSYKDILKISPDLIDFLLRRVEEEEFEEQFGPFEEESMEEMNLCEICGNYSEDLKKVNGRWTCEECREKSGFT